MVVVVVVQGRTHFFANWTFGSNIAGRAGQTLELSGQSYIKTLDSSVTAGPLG